MSRRASFALLAFGLVQCSAAAQVDVAPAPREIRPDGSRDPAPTASRPGRKTPWSW